MPVSDVLSASLAARSAEPPSPSSPLREKTTALETPASQKLRKAAGEFESMLLSNLWKSMKSTFASSDDQSDDPAHETLDDMGIQAMSSAVGKAGGLGLGKLIIKHLEPLLANSQKGNSAGTGKASALPADTFLEKHRGAKAQLKISQLWPIGTKDATNI